MLKNIDTSNWQTYRFDEIATSISEKVDPTNTDLEIYVGLEHLDAESIHIKRLGKPGDVKGLKLRCYPGDVIFGKRRAYQRKASIVEFDGFCSAHSLVLRANPKIIEPELFPFFLHSDLFMHRAVDISVGSLSPTINWKTLKHQEFNLPPKDQQAKIAELLWAMDDVVENEKDVFSKTDISFKALAKVIADIDKNHSNEYRKIKEVANIKDNLRKPLNSSQRSNMQGDIPYYGANGLVDYLDNYIFDEELVLIAEDGGNFSEFYKKPIAYKVYGKSWINNHAHVLTVKKDGTINNDWLYYSLVHKNVVKYVIGTTRVKLNKSELENIHIWCPDKEKQRLIITEIKRIEKIRAESVNQIHYATQLQKSLINEIFAV